MGAHVFVVDKYSYPVHANKGFCGVKNPKGGGKLGLITDMKALRRNDLVFFYHRRIDEPPLQRGFRDIFRIISEPFFDNSDVSHNDHVVMGKCPSCKLPYSEVGEQGELKCPSCHERIPEGHHILPYRVLIERVERFDKPVDDNTAYIDAEDLGELYTLRWRKVTGAGRARSVQHILPEEVKKLKRLFYKINQRPNQLKTENYIDVKTANQLKMKPTLEMKDMSGEPIFSVSKNGKFIQEYGLEAWIMENIDKQIPMLGEIVGPLNELEYFGSDVQYGVGGEKTDVLLLHKRRGVRFKATLMELKKDPIDESTIKQVLDPERQNYAKWVGQLATANADPPVRSLEIQPVMIGFRVEESARREISRLRSSGLFLGETIIRYPQPRPECIVRVLEPITLSYAVREGTVIFS